MFPFEQKTDRPNLYYIKGNAFSVAIDAGNSAKHVQLFYKELRANGFELPKYTIITHWDYTFGLHAIHGKSIASTGTNKQLTTVSTWQWTKEKMAEREQSGEDISFCNQCIIEEYENLSDIQVITAEEEVEEYRELDLGNIHLQMIARDSTHSRDSLFVYIPEEKALFVGDADCEDHYDNGGRYDNEKLTDLIQFFKSLDYEYHLMGHDFPDSKTGALEYLILQLNKLKVPVKESKFTISEIPCG